MEAARRREAILDLLKAHSSCLTGQELAERLAVSRQVIVNDVALLRASGESILATPRGYMIYPKTDKPRCTVACIHDPGDIREELRLVVDNGATVLDVAVDHPLYGDLRGTLMLSSRREVDDFVSRLKSSGAQPLAALTGGVHLHTLEAPSHFALKAVVSDLGRAGFLLDDR